VDLRRGLAAVTIVGALVVSACSLPDLHGLTAGSTTGPTRTGPSAPGPPDAEVGAGASVEPAGPEVGAGANPLDHPEGDGRGLGPVPADRLAEARALIEGVRTAGRGPKTGYERERFGPRWTDAASVLWSRNGCDTRNDILRRDLVATDVRNCAVYAGTIAEPYTGEAVAFSREHPQRIQIDHVVPLAYAWQMGAAGWDDDRRRDLANDPLNLLAVDGGRNAAKKDASIASWLPPNRSIRCAYAVRQAQVVLRYDLPVTPADKAMMQQVCR